MAVFGARDHPGDVLVPAEPSRPRRPQLTLEQIMKGVASAAVALTIVFRRPDLISLEGLLIVLIFGVCLAGLAMLPYRIRLTIELAMAFGLLFLVAWQSRPDAFYDTQARRCETLSFMCGELARAAADRGSRDRFRRDGAEYGRRAVVLRIQAVWYGMLLRMTMQQPMPLNRMMQQHPMPLDDRELNLERSLVKALDQHAQIGERMGIPWRNRRP